MKLKTRQFSQGKQNPDRDAVADMARVLSQKDDTKSKKDTLSLGDKLGLFYQAAPRVDGGENTAKNFYSFYLTRYAKRNRTQRVMLDGLPTGGKNDF